jgi:plastocyanin
MERRLALAVESCGCNTDSDLFQRTGDVQYQRARHRPMGMVGTITVRQFNG